MYVNICNQHGIGQIRATRWLCPWWILTAQSPVDALNTQNYSGENWTCITCITCKCNGYYQVVSNKNSTLYSEYHMQVQDCGCSDWTNGTERILKLCHQESDQNEMPGEGKIKIELSWALFLIFFIKPLLWCISNLPGTEANSSLCYVLLYGAQACHGTTMMKDRLSAAWPTWQVAEYLFCRTHSPPPHDSCQSSWRVCGVSTSLGPHDTWSTSPANDQQICGIHVDAAP